MADKFYRQASTLESPASYAFTITKSDSTVFDQPTRYVWVGGAGNIKVDMVGQANTPIIFSGITAGTMLPIRVTKVYSANTTATLIIGLY